MLISEKTKKYFTTPSKYIIDILFDKNISFSSRYYFIIIEIELYLLKYKRNSNQIKISANLWSSKIKLSERHIFGLQKELEAFSYISITRKKTDNKKNLINSIVPIIRSNKLKSFYRKEYKIDMRGFCCYKSNINYKVGASIKKSTMSIDCNTLTVIFSSLSLTSKDKIFFLYINYLYYRVKIERNDYVNLLLISMIKISSIFFIDRANTSRTINKLSNLNYINKIKYTLKFKNKKNKIVSRVFWGVRVLFSLIYS